MRHGDQAAAVTRKRKWGLTQFEASATFGGMELTKQDIRLLKIMRVAGGVVPSSEGQELRLEELAHHRLAVQEGHVYRISVHGDIELEYASSVMAHVTGNTHIRSER